MNSSKGVVAGNFADDYRRVYSPWGEIQESYKIAPGVQWVTTASHGGLMVSEAKARKELSAAAYKLGDKYQGWLCYEEDAQFVIPFYENPEWESSLVSKAGGKVTTPVAKESAINSYYPQYFKMLEQGIDIGRPVKVWDTLRTTRDIPLRSGSSLPKGTQLIVTKRTPGYVFADTPVGKMRLPLSMIDEGAVELLG
jgi:hypothetical protein